MGHRQQKITGIHMGRFFGQIVTHSKWILKFKIGFQQNIPDILNGFEK